MSDLLGEFQRVVDERRAREEQSLRLERRWHEAQQWAAWFAAETEQLRQRVRAVHQPYWNEGFSGQPWQQCAGCLQDYPCLTIRATEPIEDRDA